MFGIGVIEPIVLLVLVIILVALAVFLVVFVGLKRLIGIVLAFVAFGNVVQSFGGNEAVAKFGYHGASILFAGTILLVAAKLLFGWPDKNGSGWERASSMVAGSGEERSGYSQQAPDHDAVQAKCETLSPPKEPQAFAALSSQPETHEPHWADATSAALAIIILLAVLLLLWYQISHLK